MGLTKLEARKAIDNGDAISINTLWASKSGNGVYINCYPDCNCSQDSYSSFEEFWKYWGPEFEDVGRIE